MRKTTNILVFGLLLFIASDVSAQSKESSYKEKAFNPCVIPPLEQIDRKIDRTAACHGLPARLFRSLIWAESANRPRALSNKGAACLTQLMPATARRYRLRVDQAIDERYDTDKCLNAGAEYLGDLLRWFKGDVRLALAGYNAGEGAVYKFGWRVPPYKETVQYVEKILYIFSGKRGHGVAAAYNPELAAVWANDLYAKNRFSRPAEVDRPVAPAQIEPNDTLPESTPETVSQTEVTAEVSEKPLIKKTSRIRIAEIRPRLKTTSSFFWRESRESPEK